MVSGSGSGIREPFRALKRSPTLAEKAKRCWGSGAQPTQPSGLILGLDSPGVTTRLLAFTLLF